MCSSTTAERQSLASRDRTCCLRRCLPARPLRYYGFRGSMAHPTQSLCTLRARRRRRPRNTRYRAPATAYPDRSLTGRTTPAFLAHKQSIDPQRKCGLLRRFAPRNDERQSGNHAAVRPRLDAGFSVTPSCCSSHRLRSSPPPYPVSDPLAPITRWQGTTILIGLEPLAWPTARTALGMSRRAASAP